MDSLREEHEFDRIRKMLRSKMDYSFVIAYELLKDQKNKQLRS